MLDSPGRVLRKLIEPGPVVPAPGAHNALAARMIERAGFRAVYVTGSGVAGTTYGLPDVGLVSLGEYVAAVRPIVDAVDVPVIVDADTGFGGPANVARTVAQLEGAGAAALHIEDQVYPRRCGFLSGVQLVGVKEMCARLATAREARKDDDFVIIARTEARAVPNFDEAIARAQAYAGAGADITFVNGVGTVEEARRVVEEIPGPHLFNYSGSDLSPQLSTVELTDLGYAVAIYPIHLARAAMSAMQGLLSHLAATGEMETHLSRLASREAWEDVTEVAASLELEDRYLSGL